MEIKVPHNKSQEDARKALDAVAEAMSMEVTWINDTKSIGTVSVGGFKVSGNLEVRPTEVIVNFKLPRMARMFAGRVEEGVASKLKEALE